MINERRAYKRFLLHSQVEITGVDGSGLQFAERSRVEDVGDLGCHFSMRGAVHRGSVLGVEPLGPNGENVLDEFPRLFVIVWVKRKGKSVRENQESARSCSARLQAGTLESSTCPPESGRYTNQKRVLTDTRRGKLQHI